MTKTARRKRDREATEQRLLNHALKVMERDGVLAGLNLATVADEAGVNRGQIYQYFGNRQNLLRAALEKTAWKTVASNAGGNLPFAERRIAVTKSAIENVDRFKLMALLVLDGDSSFPLFPYLEKTKTALKKDQLQGSLHPERDAIMCHLLSAMIYLGYGVFRESIARESGIDPEELDSKTIEIVADILEHLAKSPPRSVNGK